MNAGVMKRLEVDGTQTDVILLYVDWRIVASLQAWETINKTRIRVPRDVFIPCGFFLLGDLKP